MTGPLLLLLVAAGAGWLRRVRTADRSTAFEALLFATAFGCALALAADVVT